MPKTTDRQRQVAALLGDPPHVVARRCQRLQIRRLLRAEDGLGAKKLRFGFVLTVLILQRNAQRIQCMPHRRGIGAQTRLSQGQCLPRGRFRLDIVSLSRQRPGALMQQFSPHQRIGWLSGQAGVELRYGCSGIAYARKQHAHGETQLGVDRGITAAVRGQALGPAFEQRAGADVGVAGDARVGTAEQVGHQICHRLRGARLLLGLLLGCQRASQRCLQLYDEEGRGQHRRGRHRDAPSMTAQPFAAAIANGVGHGLHL